MPRRPVHLVPAALLACALAVACGESPPVDPGEENPKKEPAVSVTARPITGARRGPVLLGFQLSGAVEQVTGIRLELREGEAWREASTLWIERNGALVLAAWSSFEDLSSDAAAKLRLVATTAAEAASGEVELELRNHPEADRLITVGHKLGPAEGGGVTNSGFEVSAVRWSGRDAAVVGSPRRLEVGQGPSRLRAAPHGRATVVLEDREGTLSLLLTPLDAAVASVTTTLVPRPEYGSFSDVRWSGDGRYFFASGYKDYVNDRPAALWRYEPAEDLSSVPPPTLFATLPGPPSRFDVDRVSGRILVSCGSGGAGLSKFVLIGAHGQEIDRLEADVGFANGLAIHPRGGFALWTSSIFGDEVRRFRFDASSLVEVGEPITSIASPEEVLFHPGSAPGSGVALVANGERNSVTPLSFDGDDYEKGPAVSGIPLSYELDLIERGSQAGVVFSTAVTEIVRVRLDPNGTAVKLGSIIDFGEGTEAIVEGVAVQR